MKKTSTIKPPIRVAVVDGDPLRFVGLRSFLAAESDLELVATPLFCLPSRQDLDVILLWNHSDKATLEALGWLNTQKIRTPRVLTGKGMPDETLLQALGHGAKGYIDETTPAAEFARAIRAVQQGSIWASRRLLSAFVETHAKGLGSVRHSSEPITPREKQVLEMLVAGRSNKEISTPLGIEERTVKAHIAKLMRKVGVKNRIMLSVHAISQSLVSAQ
jgi:DNA-binding NarL/FixJ family response regulator